MIINLQSVCQVLKILFPIIGLSPFEVVSSNSFYFHISRIHFEKKSSAFAREFQLDCAKKN